jgi:DNA-binding GntR family transcriptional regulator
MSVVFAPTENATLTDTAAEAIRTAIINGALKPGARLSETFIANQMQLSRGPVREALRLLEKEGLVIRTPRKGSCVVTLTAGDIEELYSFRGLLEGFAIRRAMQYMGRDDIERFRTLVKRIKGALNTDDPRKENDLTLRFHREILVLSRHRRLLEAWTTIGHQVWLCSALASHMRLPLASSTLTHEDILEALQRGDPDAAEQTIRDHIAATGRAVLARFSAGT